MNDFDVMAAFRTALTESHDPDPANVARAVAAGTPVRHRADALAQALVRLAPTIAGDLRRTAMGSATPALGRDRWSNAGAVYKATLLDQRVSVRGVDMFMRDCTAGDLRWLAERNREHARVTVMRAEQYERIAALVVERGVRTVGDLDRDDLDGLAAA